LPTIKILVLGFVLLGAFETKPLARVQRHAIARMTNSRLPIGVRPVGPASVPGAQSIRFARS
jgi:hypothetical protein